MNSEPYMKHTMTPLEGHNDHVSFADIIFGNCFLGTKIGCYQSHSSSVPLDKQLELLPFSVAGANESYNIDIHSNSNCSIGRNIVANNIWTLYFDGSKM